MDADTKLFELVYFVGSDRIGSDRIGSDLMLEEFSRILSFVSFLLPALLILLQFSSKWFSAYHVTILYFYSIVFKGRVQHFFGEIYFFLPNLGGFFIKNGWSLSAVCPLSLNFECFGRINMYFWTIFIGYGGSFLFCNTNG